MKKFCIGLLTCLLFVTPTFAKTETLSVNGKNISVDTQQISGRTLIPLRKIADAFGLNTVFYANSNTTDKNAIIVNGQMSTGNSNSIFVKMNVDSNIAIVQSNQVTLDVAPKLINGSVYVPLRFICEAFNGSINVIDGKISITTQANSTNSVTTPANKISSTELKNLGVKFITINNEKVISLSNSAVYYEIGSNTIDTKYKLGKRTTIQLSDKVEVINGITFFPKEVMNYLYEDSDTNTNTGSNQQTGTTSLKRSDYIHDSDILQPFVKASSEMLDQLINQKRYGLSFHLQAATKLDEWAGKLSTQTIFTPEGKALKDATINDLKAIEKGFRNLYNGKNLDYDLILNTQQKSYTAIQNFRIALEKVLL